MHSSNAGLGAGVRSGAGAVDRHQHARAGATVTQPSCHHVANQLIVCNNYGVLKDTFDYNSYLYDLKIGTHLVTLYAQLYRVGMPNNLTLLSILRWLRCISVSVGVVILATQLTGCITTAVILATQYAEKMPPFCSKLPSTERAITERCGGYKVGQIDAKDVNVRVMSSCALTNFASRPSLWHGLPELLAKGATPEGCPKAPLLAMAEANACPAFTQMDSGTLDAVRWLAVADAASVSGPVLRMLSCPEATSAGLNNVVEQWAAQGYLAPSHVSFSVLSSVHPSSLLQPWVQDLVTAGHEPLRAVEADASGYAQALAQGDVAALDWWTQKAPALVHRVPSKGRGYVPWLPLARTMTPGFAADDATRLRTAQFLIARGARMDASLPHERSISVGDYARSVQPQMWPALQTLWQRSQAEQPALSSQLTAQPTKVLASTLPPQPL